MGHHCHHHHAHTKDTRLYIAIAINILLTIAQIIGGVLSGSLSLVADAFHNVSDAASLVIALIARKIGRKPPDALKTYGYKRAEIIAALINTTILIIIGFYLIGEAFWRFFQPEVVEGWIVIIVAGIALVIDLVTAALTYGLAKDNMNMKAAFLHNLSDALSSLAVMTGGILILHFGWFWLDSLLTLMIAGYVLWQGFTLLPKTIHILMQGVPQHLIIEEMRQAMLSISGITDVRDLHIWQLDEHDYGLEACLIINNITDFPKVEKLKNQVKTLLKQQFHIQHITLETAIYSSANP